MQTAARLVTISCGAIVWVATIVHVVVQARGREISHQGRVTLLSTIILGSALGLAGLVGVVVSS